MKTSQEETVGVHDPFESLELFEMGACNYQTVACMLAKCTLRVFEGSGNTFEGYNKDPRKPVNSCCGKHEISEYYFQ